MKRWLSLFLFTVASYAATPYVAQTSAGGNTGADCTNARAVSSLTSGDWAAGNTIHLCGTITSTLTVQGSGSSGNVVTVKWETGARISQAVAQGVNLNGAAAYLLFDGGIPCGPSTACDTIEAANQTGYATGQTGIIEATANGSALANQNNTSQAFYGCNGCHDIEIRNLIIRNLYIHTSLSDTTSSVDSFADAFTCPGNNSGCATGTISIHDSTIHDTGNALEIAITSATTVNIYKIDFYRDNWAASLSGTGTRTLNFHDNHIHDTANWDTTSDAFHHNGLHVFMANAADSTAINFYNNLSDGDWGADSTSLSFYIDTGGFGVPNNVNAFNNVCLQHSGNLQPCWYFAATTGVFLNNTAIGTGNGVALNIGGTNLTIKNNVITGWQQYLTVAAGATFAAFDYNTYGSFAASGCDTWGYHSGGCSGATTFTSWKSTCSCDSHGQQNNTLLLNANGTIQSGSPVIGAGTSLTSLSITALNSDATGNARPATGAWDIGAYNYLTSGVNAGGSLFW